MDAPYRVHPVYDIDLALLNGDELDEALETPCLCGHRRREHHGAMGALASFGGSACELCWTCATYRPSTAGAAAAALEEARIALVNVDAAVREARRLSVPERPSESENGPTDGPTE